MALSLQPARGECAEVGAEDVLALAVDDLKDLPDEAAAAIPQEWLELSNFVGPEGFVRERVAAFAEAGVTVLMIRPAGPDALADVERMRALADQA